MVCNTDVGIVHMDVKLRKVRGRVGEVVATDCEEYGMEFPEDSEVVVVVLDRV